MNSIRSLIAALALAAGIVPALAQAPPVPSLPDTERRTTYVISATTCACNVNFALYGDGTDYQSWVEVWLNGVQLTYNDLAFGWTITSPTGSLTSHARPITDAVLTFANVQTGTVQIVGARRPRRLSQVSESQGVAARDFNQIITDVVAQTRETWDKVNDVTGRSVVVPPGETLTVLPPKASRANMGMCFDSNGNVAPCVAASGTTFTAGNGISFTGTNPTTIANNITAGTNISITGTNPLVISSSTTPIFAAGIAVGAGAAAPATADIYNYSATGAPQWFATRDQILGAGSAISDMVFKGQNSSGTMKSWADIYAAPPFCRGRPSFSGDPCAPNVLVAGSEEGAVYITAISSNTVTLATNGVTAVGNATLSFASSVQDSGYMVGRTVTDVTHPTAIPAGTFVRQESSTTIGLSQNVAAPGVSNGDTITFSGPDMTWFDANGLSVGGQRNLRIGAGYGYGSFDSAGTYVYNMSFNSHGNNRLDLQTCNDLSFTCTTLGAVGAFNIYTGAAGAGQPVFAINYDGGVKIQGLGTKGVGVSKICIDASGYLTTNTCP